MSKRLFQLALIATLTIPPAASAQELSAKDVFRKASQSVVVIEVKNYPKDRPEGLIDAGGVIATGSGVVVPSHDKDKTVIVTNCHVVDQAPFGAVAIAQGELRGIGWLVGKDDLRDLCVLNALIYEANAEGVPLKTDEGEVVYRKLPPAQLGSSQQLEVGDPVYAVGTPQGMELTLSNGLVSGFRELDGTEYIQTTAPISKGSSGGGLFDSQGRLVGITTMYLKDSQALNFAVPAELIASVPPARRDDVQPAKRTPEPEPAPPRDRWLEVGSTASSVAYVDTQTLQRSGGDVTVWVKFVLNKPETDKAGDTYDEELDLSSYHCASRQSTRKVFSQRLRGNPVWSHEYRSYEQERESIMPGTVDEAIMDAVCDGI